MVNRYEPAFVTLRGSRRIVLRQVHTRDDLVLQCSHESMALLNERAFTILHAIDQVNFAHPSKRDNFLSKRDLNGNEPSTARELLRRAAKVSFEVTAKV